MESRHQDPLLVAKWCAANAGHQVVVQPSAWVVVAWVQRQVVVAKWWCRPGYAHACMDRNRRLGQPHACMDCNLESAVGWVVVSNASQAAGSPNTALVVQPSALVQPLTADLVAGAFKLNGGAFIIGGGAFIIGDGAFIGGAFITGGGAFGLSIH